MFLAAFTSRLWTAPQSSQVQRLTPTSVILRSASPGQICAEGLALEGSQAGGSALAPTRAGGASALMLCHMSQIAGLQDRPLVGQVVPPKRQIVVPSAHHRR